jgi:phosphatidate phosphatase APP1
MVYEKENNSIRRNAILKWLVDVLDLDQMDFESELFKQRARAFLVDHERNKTVTIRLGEQSFELAETGANGHFTSTLSIPDSQVASLLEVRQGTSSWLPFRAITSSESRHFTGAVQLFNETGVSVISDIDDTIKISNVRDRKELMANTFVREFRAVPGMAEAYQQWATQGATFHYVSASPWQLYEALNEFLLATNFPAGTTHMKQIRVKDESIRDLLASPEEYKLKIIEPLLTAFPQRKFVLVGDSGEKDPEVYGILARRHSNQIIGIFIRDVTGEDSGAERYLKSFKDVPNDRWTIFTEPSYLDRQFP